MGRTKIGKKSVQKRLTLVPGKSLPTFKKKYIYNKQGTYTAIYGIIVKIGALGHKTPALNLGANEEKQI